MLKVSRFPGSHRLLVHFERLKKLGSDASENGRVQNGCAVGLVSVTEWWMEDGLLVGR